MTRFTPRRLITSDGMIDRPVISVEEGRIVKIEAHSVSGEIVAHDLGESTLTPGFLDIHMHGASGHDVMEAEPSALDTVSAYLARAGVTRYLATTVTASLDTTFRAVEGIAGYMRKEPLPSAAAVAGIHIEGPFVSHAKRGMHPAEHIVAPSAHLLDRLWDASLGTIRLMTIAPELPGALETIARAKELGIRTSIGHSNATRAEALAALAAGAASATHTFNAMRALDHREPGILGVVLDRDDLFADIICDGLHVSPEAVRLWFKTKGEKLGILITDSLEATGMPDGTYKLGETRIHLRDHTCTTDSGVLAGSVITLDRAVANLQRFTGADIGTAARMASVNPARMLGLPDPLKVGQPANFNIFDQQGRRSGAIVRGHIVPPLE